MHIGVARGVIADEPRGIGRSTHARAVGRLSVTHTEGAEFAYQVARAILARP